MARTRSLQQRAAPCPAGRPAPSGTNAAAAEGSSRRSAGHRRCRSADSIGGPGPESDALATTWPAAGGSGSPDPAVPVNPRDIRDKAQWDALIARDRAQIAGAIDSSIALGKSLKSADALAARQRKIADQLEMSRRKSIEDQVDMRLLRKFETGKQERRKSIQSAGGSRGPSRCPSHSRMATPPMPSFTDVGHGVGELLGDSALHESTRRVGKLMSRQRGLLHELSQHRPPSRSGSRRSSSARRASGATALRRASMRRGSEPAALDPAHGTGTPSAGVLRRQSMRRPSAVPDRGLHEPPPLVLCSSSTPCNRAQSAPRRRSVGASRQHHADPAAPHAASPDNCCSPVQSGTARARAASRGSISTQGLSACSTASGLSRAASRTRVLGSSGSAAPPCAPPTPPTGARGSASAAPPLQPAPSGVVPVAAAGAPRAARVSRQGTGSQRAPPAAASRSMSQGRHTVTRVGASPSAAQRQRPASPQMRRGSSGRSGSPTAPAGIPLRLSDLRPAGRAPAAADTPKPCLRAPGYTSPQQQEQRQVTMGAPAAAPPAAPSAHAVSASAQTASSTCEPLLSEGSQWEGTLARLGEALSAGGRPALVREAWDRTHALVRGDLLDGAQKCLMHADLLVEVLYEAYDKGLSLGVRAAARSLLLEIATALPMGRLTQAVGLLGAGKKLADSPTQALELVWMDLQRINVSATPLVATGEKGPEHLVRAFGQLWPDLLVAVESQDNQLRKAAVFVLAEGYFALGASVLPFLSQLAVAHLSVVDIYVKKQAATLLPGRELDLEFICAEFIANRDAAGR